MNDICPKYYEKLLTRQLISANGLNCVQQEVALAAQDQNVGLSTAAERWRKYNCKLTKVVEGDPPLFEEMAIDTLYHPTNPSFPFVEFFYKDCKNNLVALQVTRQRSGAKMISHSAFEKFLKEIEFPVTDVEKKFKLIFIPAPKQADKMRLRVTPEKRKGGCSVDHISQAMLPLIFPRKQ